MKADIKDIKDVPLEDLEIAKGQVRTRDVGKDIDELAESIRVMGLLEPIVVCPTDKPGKYEILTGQRRFLAHKQLKKKTIKAAILSSRVDEATAKAISLTENLVRRDLENKELIDACVALFKKYGTIKAVSEETGIAYNKVATYVKYDRLIDPLKKMVDTGKVDMKTALKAQDVATTEGETDDKEAVKLATEMAGMSGAQQRKVEKLKQDEPDLSAAKLIEAAKSKEKVTQILVTLGANVHGALQKYAQEEGTNQDAAAADLIEESLGQKGYTKG